MTRATQVECSCDSCDATAEIETLDRSADTAGWERDPGEPRQWLCPDCTRYGWDDDRNEAVCETHDVPDDIQWGGIQTGQPGTANWQEGTDGEGRTWRRADQGGWTVPMLVRGAAAQEQALMPTKETTMKTTEAVDMIVIDDRNNPPQIRRVTDGFKGIQELVGGYIEPVYLTEHRDGTSLVAWVDEDGIGRGLDPNRVVVGASAAGGAILFGRIVVARERVDEEGETHYTSATAIDLALVCGALLPVRGSVSR